MADFSDVWDGYEGPPAEWDGYVSDNTGTGLDFRLDRGAAGDTPHSADTNVDWGDTLKKFGNFLSSPAGAITALAGLGGIAGLDKPRGVPGYTGGIPNLRATRGYVNDLDPKDRFGQQVKEIQLGAPDYLTAQRQAVALARSNGLTPEQAAEYTGISADDAKTLYDRYPDAIGRRPGEYGRRYLGSVNYTKDSGDYSYPDTPRGGGTGGTGGTGGGKGTEVVPTSNIIKWLRENSTASDATIRAAMDQYGVTPDMLYAAFQEMGLADTPGKSLADIRRRYQNASGQSGDGSVAGGDDTSDTNNGSSGGDGDGDGTDVITPSGGGSTGVPLENIINWLQQHGDASDLEIRTAMEENGVSPEDIYSAFQRMGLADTPGKSLEDIRRRYRSASDSHGDASYASGGIASLNTRRPGGARMPTSFGGTGINRFGRSQTPTEAQPATSGRYTPIQRAAAPAARAVTYRPGAGIAGVMTPTANLLSAQTNLRNQLNSGIQRNRNILNAEIGRGLSGEPLEQLQQQLWRNDMEANKLYDQGLQGVDAAYERNKQIAQAENQSQINEQNSTARTQLNTETARILDQLRNAGVNDVGLNSARDRIAEEYNAARTANNLNPLDNFTSSYGNNLVSSVLANMPAPNMRGTGGFATGGIVALRQGGPILNDGDFVMTAKAVSGAGGGNTNAGAAKLSQMFPEGTYIAGSDDGTADTVMTSIDGVEPAKVSHGEFIVRGEDPKKMAKLMKKLEKGVGFASGGIATLGNQPNPWRRAPMMHSRARPPSLGGASSTPAPDMGGVGGGFNYADPTRLGGSGGGAPPAMGGMAAPNMGGVGGGFNYADPTRLGGSGGGAPPAMGGSPSGIGSMAAPNMGGVGGGFNYADPTRLGGSGGGAPPAMGGMAAPNMGGVGGGFNYNDPTRLGGSGGGAPPVRGFAEGGIAGLGSLTNSPTTRESNLSAWAGPYVADYLGKGRALANMDYMPYFGPLTAGASDLQQKAFDEYGGPDFKMPLGFEGARQALGGAQDALGNMNPYEAVGGSFTDDGVASRYMNPFIMNALNPALEEMKRQADITRVGDAQRLTKAGAYGGSRQALLEGENNRNLMDKQGRFLTEGMASAYDKAANQYNEEQRRNIQEAQFGSDQGLKRGEALGRLGSTWASTAAQEGNTMIQGLESLLRAGGIQRDIESQGIAADQAQFEEERMWPYKQLQFQQSLMNGLPVGTSTTSTAQSPYQQLGNLGSGMTGLYDMLNKLGLGDTKG